LVEADPRIPEEFVGKNAMTMSEGLVKPMGGAKISKQQVRDAVEVRTTRPHACLSIASRIIPVLPEHPFPIPAQLILAYAGNDPTAAMVEMGEMVSMKFKGEYPSVDLLCRRTIQRCKDDAAESKERKLAEAKRATDATLERVGSLRIGGSAPKETVKSPARVKPRLSAEDQEWDDRPATADSALSWDSDRRSDSSTSSWASQGRNPRGLRPTQSLDDDHMRQWLANKKLKEEERSKLKKAGSQKDLRWMKQLSEKQLVRNKSLRKEEEAAAAKAKIAAMGGRDPRAEREAALEALAKQEQAERSRANSPAERPPTVEEAAARLFGDL